MKGYFLIKAKDENIVSEKGVRAFIMEKLLNCPFSRGTVVNLDKKTVQVKIEGDERTIKAFMKELQKALPEQFGNPTIFLAEFQEDSSLEIPELMRSSQALMVGQLQKGISVQLEILETLKGSENSLKSLPEQISEAISKTLPREIAKSIKKS